MESREKVSRVEKRPQRETTKARAHETFERPSQRGGFFYPAGFPSLAKRVHGLDQQLLSLFLFSLFSSGLFSSHEIVS
jgi:hypothetical protein